jgi:UDP-N-acetylglucosamine 2-epimerase
MKLVTLVGAWPQFIKAASLSRAIQNYNSQEPPPRMKEIMVHTGQYYDEIFMSWRNSLTIGPLTTWMPSSRGVSITSRNNP